MSSAQLHFDHPITLVGGGALRSEDMRTALARAPTVIAADGAADKLAAMDICPDAIIGDMDSIRDVEAWESRAQVLPITEQDSTDFEKCLYATKAPLYLGVGFTGRRVDHMLAVFHAMLARPDRQVVLVGEEDVIALIPTGGVRVALAPGARVSLFPLNSVRCVRSEGLEWPVDGMEMRTGLQVGTSNRAVAEAVEIVPEGPGLLLMVEPRWLDAVIASLG